MYYNSQVIIAIESYLENKNVQLFRGSRNQGIVYGNWLSLGKESIRCNKEDWRDSPVMKLLTSLISGSKLVITMETITYRPASSLNPNLICFSLVCDSGHSHDTEYFWTVGDVIYQKLIGTVI